MENGEWRMEPEPETGGIREGAICLRSEGCMYVVVGSSSSSVLYYAMGAYVRMRSSLYSILLYSTTLFSVLFCDVM